MSTPRQKAVITWLLVIKIMVLCMIAIGGITRLTDSGLSMVEWTFQGSLPPLSDAAWQEEFAKYQAHPEFMKLRPDMKLPEFKRIFFWEYLHRMFGRAIGLAFLLPLLFFLARRSVRGAPALHAVGAFLLIVLQGLVGWYMVKSGLVHNPHVSHFRLAAHLLLAFSLFAWLGWILLELLGRAPARAEVPRSAGWSVTALIVVQITWGAFVAGMEAGGMYNTWPLMQGRFVPPGFLALEPALHNLVNNPGAIQFVHRWLAALVVIAVTALWWKCRSRWAARLLLGLVLVQFLLGITTLVLQVPIVLGVLHQLTAVLLLAASVALNHGLHRSLPDSK